MMNGIRTTLLLASLTGLMLLIGGALGGRGGMMIALLFSLVMNMGTYWYSDKIVLKMYHAKEVTPAEAPELYSIVRGLVDRAKMPMPKVYIVDTPMPNAFATGRNPSHAAVAATTGIMRVLDKEELEAVMAHELSHVRNRDTLISSVAATIAGVITFVANMAQWSLIFGGGNDDDGGNIVGIIAMAILAPIAALIIQMAISRSREFGADAGAAELSGHPMALARALSKLEQAAGRAPADVNPSTAHMFIVNPLKGKKLASLFSTHPSTEERIARLSAMQ
ncbi:MAG: zinc metalloprotease HtpX [Methanothrix sp.]|jgi:heat shock protein HtpX|nr:MAG: protease HtpX [Methanosaeta sp. SDB]MDD3708983.1 zinc metalloprotease HtpX [Methanothrix sp.]MDI9398212.1 zinc metalloprotease HtpX [Euryarchaeota archaeon]